MYRQVIEHPEWIPKEWQKRLDLRAGHDKGRIYRVYPVGRRPRPIPRLDRLGTAELVAALDSPSGWQRDLAQQMLIRHHDPAAIPLLEKQAAENGRPLCRLHALCTLDGLDALTPAVLQRALTDSHPGIRRHAVRFCEPRLAQSPALGTTLMHFVNDPDPQVRLQLACTLGEWNDPRAGRALGQLALEDAGDRFLSAAVMSSATQKNVGSLLQTVLAGSKSASPAHSLMDNCLRLALTLGNGKALAGVLARVARPERGKYASWQFGALANLLDAMDQRNVSLTSLKAEDDQELHATLKHLSDLFVAARVAVANRQTPRAEQLQAIRLLGRGPDHHEEDVTTLKGLLVPQTEEDLRAAAIATLGRLRDRDVPAVLLGGWKGYGPALRSQVLDILFRRDDWLLETLGAIERKQILPFEIDAARRQRLLQHRAMPIRNRVAKLFAGSVDPDRQKVVDAYRSALTLKGDSQRGVQIFTKTCASCHLLGGIGYPVGPDLASLGDKSHEFLLMAILDPNRAVETRYLNYMAVTKNGLTFTGVLASETGNSITLSGPEGKQQVILRTDLEDLVSSNKSVMPEGLEKDLKVQEVADLMAFIRAGIPTTRRKVFDGNKPEVIKPAADGTLSLLASNCEIYGKTLLWEKKHGNLRYWSSEDDHAVWSMEVTRPGKYAVWLDWACDNSTAGNSFVLEIGNSRLMGKVQGTQSWDQYRQGQIGAVNLEAGRQQLIFRSAGTITGALLDLRSIKLVPLSQK